MKRITFLLGSITVLLLAFIAFNFVTTSVTRAAPPFGVQKWEYALMVYTSKNAEVTAVTLDDDERKEINEFFQTLRDNLSTDKIPAIYYANVMGQYSFELISHETDISGELFYFKRPVQ